jgi:hypothetical protein
MRSVRGREQFLEVMATGALTPLLLPLSWLVRRAVPLEDAELAIGFVAFHAAHVLNDPHFAVTYLLFYEDAAERARSPGIALSQRVRWLLAGVVTPLALVAWIGWSLAEGSAERLGLLVQLMYLAVGWHYGKQGFGVLTVLSGRRGVSFTTWERRALLGHVYTAWAFAWASPPLAAGEYEERGVVYWAPERPEAFTVAAGVALALSTLVMVTVLAQKARREGSLPWWPIAAYLSTLWLWSIGSALDPLVRYVIPALHAVQYFYFVALLRWTEAQSEEGPPRFGRPATSRMLALALGALALGWALFRGIPALLDAELVERGGWGRLGATPFFAAFYVAVNVHHFAMDAVIWRREHAPTRWLLAREPRPLPEPTTSRDPAGDEPT